MMQEDTTSIHMCSHAKRLATAFSANHIKLLNPLGFIPHLLG